jgi:hypothetical protein
MAHEPNRMQEATDRVVYILDAKYEKTDLQSIFSTYCTHLSLQHQNMLLELLTGLQEPFDRTLGDWKTKHIFFELKEDTKPFHDRPYPVPKAQ